MRIIFSLLLTTIFLLPGAEAQFKDLLKKAKSTILNEDDDIGFGLKEALEVGVEDAVTKLSTEKGYLESPYKILIPEEAQKVCDKLKFVPGFEKVESDLVQKMNEAAEKSAKKAVPIFGTAIKELSFEDAMKILMGEKDEATRYLENKTRKGLYKAFLPVIQASLDEVGAREFWTTAVTAYNKIPLTRDVNPQLDDHVNQKALDGLFGFIEVKEQGIRTDMDQRTSPLLKKVFAKQDQ